MTPTGPQQPLGDRFKAAMGSVCTPVSIVTVLDGERPHGTTVSAISSLSLEPPMVMLAVDQGSALLQLLRSIPRFGISVLAERQGPVATNFATKGEDKFRDVPWIERCGAPFVVDAACWFACETTQLVPGGDHVVVLASVLDAGHEQHAPLTYHRRVFGTHTELTASLGGLA